MTNVMERVQKHYDKAVEHYGSNAVLGVFCYGSWNYNTALEDSDVDTKCILVPDIWSLAIKPYKVKHLDIDGEVCECMTIMHMVANWKKQNINFVEIMFTDYCIINPLYEKVWNVSFNKGNRELVARYDLYQAIHSMVYQAIHTIKQDPTCPKKIMNGARIADTLDNLLDNPNMSYKDCIWMRDEVRELRFRAPQESEVKILLFVLEGYLENIDSYKADPKNKEVIDSYLNNLIITLIQHRMSF